MTNGPRRYAASKIITSLSAPEDTPGVLLPCWLTTPLLCWRCFCQRDLYNASQALFKLWFVYVCSVLVQSLIFLGLLSLKMSRFVLIVFVVTHPSAVSYLIINICCYFHQITDSDAYWFVSICIISITQCLKSFLETYSLHFLFIH